MCSIVCSFDKDTLSALYDLNSYRGQVSHSLFAVDDNYDANSSGSGLSVGFGCYQVVAQHQAWEPLEGDTIQDMPDYCYYIGHAQAPTNQAKNIHPATYGTDAYLWHNGIIKQGQAYDWDTQWLLEKIIADGFSVLSEVDGSFACIMLWEGWLYAFRNEISPLFYNEMGDFSSTKFDGAESLEPNKVFTVKLGRVPQLELFDDFETKQNPYYFI